MVVNVSAPTTRTLAARPAATAPAPIARPYTNPEHTAAISNAGTWSRPSRVATSGAVAGQGRSGVVVARITRSAPATPLAAADLRARPAASTARSPVATPGSTTRRSPMPVRERIHSSEVSRRWASS